MPEEDNSPLRIALEVTLLKRIYSALEVARLNARELFNAHHDSIKNESTRAEKHLSDFLIRDFNEVGELIEIIDKYDLENM